MVSKSALLTLLLLTALSGCHPLRNGEQYNHTAVTDLNEKYLNENYFPEVSTVKNEDDSLILSYMTANGVRTVNIPPIETEYYGDLQYVNVSTRPSNSNHLSSDDYDYMLGDFTSQQFINPTDVLQLQVIQDDTRFWYYLEFVFDTERQDLVLKDIYMMTLLNQCAFIQSGVKRIDTSRLTIQNYPSSISLSEIDFKALHKRLFSPDIFAEPNEKIIPDILQQKYEQLINENTPNKHEIVDLLIQTDGSKEGDGCSPEEYVTQLYYFQSDKQMSYDIATSFAEYGYKEEATLLFDYMDLRLLR